MSSKYTANDSSNGPAQSYTFNEGPGVSGSGATETVFRSIGVGNAYYNYYYDYAGRRIAKHYPSGDPDEYFYLGSGLIVDQGNDAQSHSSGAAHYHPVDDYVWLGGRIVAIVRGSLDTSYNRLSDSGTTCSREGDNSACGTYFPVTDNIGKPVIMLDSAIRIVGTGEYAPWGGVNRVTVDQETAHPYTVAQPSFGTFSVAGAGATTAQVRVKFQMLDTLGGCGSSDSINLVDSSSGSTLWSGHGLHSGSIWTGWLSPSTGSMHADLVLGQNAPFVCVKNCTFPLSGCCGWGCGTAQSNTTGVGAVIESYQYRRYESGSTPFWTPLGFPGQYHDEESDLDQNWNRFYEPLTQRYLEPEPIWQTPYPALASAYTGTQWPAYGYAGDNPINNVDRDGLDYTVDQGQATTVFNDMYSHLSPAEKEALAALKQDPTANVHIQMGLYSASGATGTGGGYQKVHATAGPEECTRHPRGNYDSNFSNLNRDVDIFLNEQRAKKFESKYGVEEPLDSALYHELFGHFFPETINHAPLDPKDNAENLRENRYRARIGLPPNPIF